MNLPFAARAALQAAALPYLLKDISPTELAAAAIQARRLASDVDVLEVGKHIAEARKLLSDALTALDNLTAKAAGG